MIFRNVLNLKSVEFHCTYYAKYCMEFTLRTISILFDYHALFAHIRNFALDKKYILFCPCSNIHYSKIHLWAPYYKVGCTSENLFKKLYWIYEHLHYQLLIYFALEFLSVVVLEKATLCSRNWLPLWLLVGCWSGYVLEILVSWSRWSLVVVRKVAPKRFGVGPAFLEICVPNR